MSVFTKESWVGSVTISHFGDISVTKSLWTSTLYLTSHTVAAAGNQHRLVTDDDAHSYISQIFLTGALSQCNARILVSLYDECRRWTSFIFHINTNYQSKIKSKGVWMLMLLVNCCHRNMFDSFSMLILKHWWQACLTSPLKLTGSLITIITIDHF